MAFLVKIWRAARNFRHGTFSKKMSYWEDPPGDINVFRNPDPGRKYPYDIFRKTQIHEIPNVYGKRSLEIPYAKPDVHWVLLFIAVPFFILSTVRIFGEVHHRRPPYKPASDSFTSPKPSKSFNEGIYTWFFNSDVNTLPMGHETDDLGRRLPKGVFQQGYKTDTNGNPTRVPFYWTWDGKPVQQVAYPYKG